MCLTAGREASDRYKSPELNQQPRGAEPNFTFQSGSLSNFFSNSFSIQLLTETTNCCYVYIWSHGSTWNKNILGVYRLQRFTYLWLVLLYPYRWYITVKCKQLLISSIITIYHSKDKSSISNSDYLIPTNPHINRSGLTWRKTNLYSFSA